MKIGIVLGSGYGDFINSLRTYRQESYSETLGLKGVRVKGHKGIFHYADGFGHEWLIGEGRIHFYEGLGIEPIRNLILHFKKNACDLLILTTATGGIKEGFDVGDIILITGFVDLFNIKWDAPSSEELLSKPYIDKARQAAMIAGIELKEGVFAGVTGPSYETKAEVRALQKLHADLVSMSVIPEVRLSAQVNLPVVCFGIITNHLVIKRDSELTHHEVLDVVKKTTPRLVNLIEAFCSII